MHLVMAFPPHHRPPKADGRGPVWSPALERGPFTFPTFMVVCEFMRRRGVRAAWAAGSNAHSATYFPATTSPSVARAFVWCPIYPFGSLRLTAN